MKIRTLAVGALATNCYLLEDEQTNLAAVIDPGDEGDRILAQLRQDGVHLALILLTHGHFDHMLALEQLHREFPDATVYIHREDGHGAGSRAIPLDDRIEDLHYYDHGDALRLGTLTIEVIHTPGHSKGSVVLRVGDVLFTGDTLFAGTCGRTDLAGGDYGQMLTSLKRLGKLEGDFQVLPGHSHSSTLDQERKTNRYMLMAAGYEA